MKRLTQSTLLFLAIDVALAILCALQVPSLSNRAAAPISVQESAGKFYIKGTLSQPHCDNVRSGDQLLLWNGAPITSAESIEFLAEVSSIGAHVPLALSRNGERVDANITLVASYSLPYIIIVFFVGLVTWSLGVFVLVSRPGNLVAGTLHWALIMMAVAVITSYEGTTPQNPMRVVSSLMFFCSYVGTAAAFLLFTALFPSTKAGSLRLKITLVFTPAIAILALMIYHYQRALAGASIEAFNAYYFWFTLFHLLLLLYVGGAVLSFVHSYITAVSTEERKKLQWILWSFSLAPLPFLALVVVPRRFNSIPPIPEEYTLLVLLVIPLAFVVSFMRHRLLDIELVIRRTTAYAIVIGVLLGAYVALVSLVALLVERATASAAAAIVVALFFEPLRRGVQHFVDKHFFRIQYDYRRAEYRFVELVKQSLTVSQLGNTLVSEVINLIPVDRLGFFVLHQPGNRLRLIAHQGFDLVARHAPRFELEKLRTDLHSLVAVDGSLEPGITYAPADAGVFQRWGMNLVFTMHSQEATALGFLVLGRKKSALRFAVEDVDLLKNVCTQAGLAIERIALQEKLFVEHQERERLQELNQLKSDFVSYVSHDLRTPLTSIKMFAELLRSRRLKLGRKGMEYTAIIEGEADRLARMVTTILESSRIDQNIKLYDLRKMDLLAAARIALSTMQYQLDKQGFVVKLSVKPKSNEPDNVCLPINADCDAVVQAITNLISNAIKYSARHKSLKISLIRNGGTAVCTVEDRGIGISPETIPHLFEKFYRDPTSSQSAQGFGLGLPLVKHIMDAHGGRVDVVSTPGKGSTFTLSFPLLSHSLNNSDQHITSQRKP